MHNKNLNPLELSAVQQVTKHGATSESYKFIDTKQVLTQLADNGWHVVAGNQKKVKDASREGFQTHVLKLENECLNRLLPTVGKPQMLLRNAHEGSSSLQLLAAFHIFVCSNGAVQHSGDIGDVRVLHRGFTEELLQLAVADFTNRVPLMVTQVEQWKSLELDNQEATILAQEAIELRFDPLTDSHGVPTDKYPLAPHHVLQSRRYGEAPTNLWNAFNNLQENLIEKGGLRGARNANGRRTSVRAVKSPDSNVKLNKGLWALAAKMAELKGAAHV